MTLSPAAVSEKAIIEVKNLNTVLGGRTIHEQLNLTINRGEIIGVVGGSGSGKTTLLRALLSLLAQSKGSIKLFGQEIINATPENLLKIQKRWGVLFQQNALFSSFTLLENVAFPLKEHTTLDTATINELALLKIRMSGLPFATAKLYPAELSGGMQKRAGIARAIVLDPELIFMDEPTAGLDPNTAAGFDELILNLQATMGLTIVIITHDLDTLWKVTTRVAFLGEKRVLNIAPMAQLIKDPHPEIQAFFKGPRGRIVENEYGNTS